MGYRSKLSITVSAGAFVSLSFALLILPLDWVIAWLFAAFVHEAFHYGALMLCGVTVYEIRIGPFGAAMETEPMTGIAGFITALAGSVGGLALLLAARWLPRLAICGLMQSIFNLLPISPLDGSRAVGAVLQTSRKGGVIIKWMDRAAITCLLIFFLWLSVKFRLGLGGMVIFAAFLFLRNREKLLANCVNKEYNRGNPKS